MIGDRYTVYYKSGADTLCSPNGPYDNWPDARAERDRLFKSDEQVLSCWVMRTNDTYEFRADKRGKTLRRKESCEVRRPRWCIRIVRRAPFQGGDPQDWRRWRHFASWPITFATQGEAQEFMDRCFTFKNLNGRKMSASVCRCDSVDRITGLKA